MLRRPSRAETAFWLLVAGAAVAFLLWIHHRDSSHDHWDWSDWIEGTLASACGGFVVVGLLWVAGAAVGRRLPHRARVGRRRRIGPRT